MGFSVHNVYNAIIELSEAFLVQVKERVKTEETFKIALYF
jgi:hypothetical protein